MIAPQPENERERIAALESYRLLDTESDPAYDAFVKQAAAICGTPIALVCLLDGTRQWIKANVGLPDLRETPREIAFCSYTILSDDVFEIRDSWQDPRFAENPLVTSGPSIRFYAGAPLVDRNGSAIGALCAADRKPRSLSQQQRDALQQLAASLMLLIEARKEVSRASLEQIALLDKALEQTAEPALILNASVGQPITIGYANPAFSELFGYAAADIIGKEPRILDGPKTDLVKTHALRAAIAGGERGDEIVYQYTASGEPRLVEIRDRLLDADHRITTFRDLTLVHATQSALAEANERFQSLLTNNPYGVLVLDARGKCTWTNPALHALFGFTEEDLLGFGFLRFAQKGLFPGEEVFPEELRSGATMEYPAEFEHRDGRRVSVECKVIPMRVRGATEGAYVVIRDVTEAKRQAALVVEQAKRTRALYMISAAKAYGTRDQIDAALELALEAFDMAYGFVGQVFGESFFMRNAVGDRINEPGQVVEIDSELLREALVPADVLAVDDIEEAQMRRAGNVSLYPGWHGFISAPIVVGGRHFGTVGFLSRRSVPFNEFDRDFVRLVAALIAGSIERDKQRQHLNQLAFFDALTGLANRESFSKTLHSAMGHARRTGRSFAVHYIDLDGFKSVNDGWGHDAGDFVLQEGARRLQEISRVYDTPARIGGDEFVVLQADIANTSEAESLGERIVHAFSRPFVFNGETFQLGASVGISIFPVDGRDATSMLKSADRALYRAKASGKNRIEIASRTAAPAKPGLRNVIRMTK